MLNKSTIEIAANIAEITVDQQQRLVPKANTLIGLLTSAIRNGLRPEDFLDRQAIVNSVELASTGNTVHSTGGHSEYQASEHDVVMDNYISEMSVLVANYLNFARSVVNTEITVFKEKLEEQYNVFKHRDPEDFFEVSYFKLPEIFHNSSLKHEVDGTRTQSNKFTFEYVDLKTIHDEEDLLPRFLTGDENFDLDIRGWFATHTNLRQDLFTEVDYLGLSVPTSLNYFLTNYLFYRNLAERTDINTGDSTVVLRNKCKENASYFGSMLDSAIFLYNTTLKNGRLLTSDTQTNFNYLSKSQFKVVIYEDNFAKAAEQGCTIETIFGHLASTSASSSLTVAELVEGKDKYATTWSRTRSLYTAHLNNTRLDTFKHLLRLTVDAQLHKDNITEAEQEMLDKDSEFLNTGLRLSHEYIDNLSVADIDNIDLIGLELIARIRFRFTDAYILLKEMHEMLEADEDMEPMEAGLYCSIGYLLDYCLQQVDVVKV